MSKLTFKEWSILADIETIAFLEEDQEFSMARGELKTAQDAVKRLMGKLKGEGDLEAWVQSKITKAVEYLDTVADHLSHGEDDTTRKSEVKEAVLGRYKEDRGGGKTLRSASERLKTKSKESAEKSEPEGPKVTRLKTRGPRKGEATASQVQGWRGSDRTNTNRRGQSDPQAKLAMREGFKGHKSVEEIAKKHKVSPSVIQKQLEMGMKVEHEHTTDNDAAMDIALQHLDEIPNYYSKLKKMEKVKEDTEILDAQGNLFATVIDIIKGSDDKFKGFTQSITEDAVKELENGLKKLDNTSYDSIDKLMRRIMERNNMSAKELHNAFVTKHDKTPDEWINNLNERCWDGYKQLGVKKKGKKVVPNCVKEDSIDEANKSGDSSLRDWFSKSRSSDGTPGWVQLGGKYAGKPCAKQEGQTTKPKCGSSKMKSDLSDKEEESAFRRKNQEDPNPDRKGKAKMVATEDFKPLPSEKMKNKVSSLRKKSLNSDDSDSKEELIRRGGNIRTVSDTIGKSQKTRSFGTKEKEKNKSAKYAAKSFLRQHLKSTQNTKDSPDHQGRWNKMITRTDEGKEKHLEKRVKEREKRFGSNHAIKEENISEEKDACYSKVKSRYSVWPSAYASGALVKCRKVGAKNWGNKTKNKVNEVVTADALAYEWDTPNGEDLKYNWQYPISPTNLRYCPKCEKNETSKECKYGEKYWAMFSIPPSLTPEKPYSISKVHPANEQTSFEIGSGHKQAQKQAKIRNLATGTTNPNEKSAALRKLSGPSLPLADSVIQPGQLTNEDYQRIQSTGNMYTILFSWRGRPMMNLQLFFPTQKRPSKDEVKSQIDKLYPGAVLMQWHPSTTDPTKPIVVIQK